MAPPKTNPADRVSGDGALRRLARRPKQTCLPNNNSQLLAQLEATRQRLDNCAAVLEIIADWQDDLQQRIARQELIFELVDCGDRGIDLLFEEVATFKRCCQAIAWPKGGA